MFVYVFFKYRYRRWLWCYQYSHERLRTRHSWRQQTYWRIWTKCYFAFEFLGRWRLSDWIFYCQISRKVCVFSNFLLVEKRCVADNDYFLVHCFFRGSQDWTLVNNNVKASGDFVFLDLEPAQWYNLRVTAHNKAGSTMAEYEFPTLTETGGMSFCFLLFFLVVCLFYTILFCRYYCSR